MEVEFCKTQLIWCSAPWHGEDISHAMNGSQLICQWVLILNLGERRKKTHTHLLWCMLSKWFFRYSPIIGLLLVFILLPSCQSCLNPTTFSGMFPVCHFTSQSSHMPEPPLWKSPNPRGPIGPCDLLSSPCFPYWFAKCKLHLPLLPYFLHID